MHDDLEQFLLDYSELVLIHLWEAACEASLDMNQRMREVERLMQVPVIRLRLTEYREWARAHGIYGTPAVIAYHRGRPVLRLMGRVTPAERLQHLRQAGLSR